MSKLLYTDNEWDFDKLRRVDEAIKVIATEELKLDIYPNLIEIISSDQMLDAYSSHGMPMMYNHWSFGKNFLQDYYSYKKGHSGLAYEIVVNTNPVINYLMEENSMTMQALVIAHAAYGHNSFFKNNYLFRQWTDANSIVEYLAFAKKYINKCEEQHGVRNVELILDAAHAIMDYGVDRYRKPTKLSAKKEKERQKERAEAVHAQASELWSILPTQKKNDANESKKFPPEPQENILYFIEKHSPSLESWEREIVRIVRKISQYFYPQRQTKVMNEGWASFVHYYIMNRLWEKGQISDGSFLEFAQSHTGVLTQLPHDHKYYSGYNPYALGFDIYSDIRRICTEPTDEDKQFFPHLVGKDWLEVCHDAVRNYRDESFISQFLSPTVMRKWKLFEVTNNEKDSFISVTGIQNMSHYDRIRQGLSQQYSTTSRQPDIQVVDADLSGLRRLTLRYTAYNQNKLDSQYNEVLSYIEDLWGHQVILETVNA
jgi:spore cortex formation protein SpoVR/YcgB (stage V sporulation)